MTRDIAREIKSPVTSRIGLNYAASEVGPIRKEIRLPDGSFLRLRHLLREDREILGAFFAQCSAEALRFRFMSSIRSPSESLLSYLAEADGARHVALIVTQGKVNDERIVAEGRYVVLKERPDVADIALLVVDEMQRRGIATVLIRRLMDIASRKGVTHFSADVLADNRAMLSLLRKFAPPQSATVSSGVIHFELPVVSFEKERLPEAA